MIVDEQHLRLHEAAQEVCLKLDADSFVLLSDEAKDAMIELAMLCGCSHVPWFCSQPYTEEK